MKLTASEYIIQLGKKIQEERERRGLTQYKLAKEMFMEQSNLARIEDGKTNPTVKTLLKIAQILDCEVKVFFNF
jgi:transcriptional regulator with XRE-family HTH domain